jgi:quercetin dioxygenase-like cupin family protein
VIPAGVVHDAHNDTNAPTKLVGVFVVEKGKPLATPAR